MEQILTTLLNEVNQTLEETNQIYLELIDHLKSFDPYLNFSSGPNLHSESAKKILNVFKEDLKAYFSEVEHLVIAYQDLAAELQTVLGDRAAQDPLVQQLERQGNLLIQTIQARQDSAKVFIDLATLFDQVSVQQKLNPAQAKKIEDLVFRLQVLGG